MSLHPLAIRDFLLEDRRTWKNKTVIINAWDLPSVLVTELDLNREGALIRNSRAHVAFKGREGVLDHFHIGFGWQSDDAVTSHWIPQGLTGDADSTDGGDDGRKWLAVSWHNEHDATEKGMRMSFVDVTAWENPIRYRNVLLVNPIEADDDSSRPTFTAIRAHAGGAVWFRNYLYVTDSRGFDRGRPGGVLVFDMTQIKEVDESRDDAIGWSPQDDAYFACGYRYVLPQVGQYLQVEGGSGRPLRWSFIGLDRTGSKRSLMMGEYSTRNQGPARLIWWDLDRRSGRLAA